MSGGVVGDIAANTSSTALGGTASMNSSGWVVNFAPKTPVLGGATGPVPWYVWAAVGVTLFAIYRKRRKK